MNPTLPDVFARRNITRARLVIWEAGDAVHDFEFPITRSADGGWVGLPDKDDRLIISDRILLVIYREFNYDTGEVIIHTAERDTP